MSDLEYKGWQIELRSSEATDKKQEGNPHL